MRPGKNLLKMAQRAVGSQTVMYSRFSGRETNALGYDVAVYHPATALRGNLQPVPRSLYERMGLDLQKSYVTFYTDTAVLDISRGVSGDQFTYAGRIYQCQSITNWLEQDGWVAVLCVDVGADA